MKLSQRKRIINGKRGNSIMLKKVSVLLSIAAVAAFVPPCLAEKTGQAGPINEPGQGTGHEWGVSGKQWGQPANQNKNKGLPKTQLLNNNDNLLPGQNRTQAMRLEAESGHLTPEEDSVVDPILHPHHPIQPRAVKRTSVRITSTRRPIKSTRRPITSIRHSVTSVRHPKSSTP